MRVFVSTISFASVPRCRHLFLRINRYYGITSIWRGKETARLDVSKGREITVRNLRGYREHRVHGVSRRRRRRCLTYRKQQ